MEIPDIMTARTNGKLYLTNDIKEQKIIFTPGLKAILQKTKTPTPCLHHCNTSKKNISNSLHKDNTTCLHHCLRYNASRQNIVSSSLHKTKQSSTSKTYSGT